MTSENKIFCGQCGKENPNQNKFCFSCGQKLNIAETSETQATNSIQTSPEYSDIYLILGKLIKNNGFIIISKGDYYVQFDNNLSKGQFYFDAVSKAFIPAIGNKDTEFKKLSFILKENQNYHKFIPLDSISISTLIREIEFIFNNIYGIPLTNYKIETDIEITSTPEQAKENSTASTGCLGVILILTLFSFGTIFTVFLLLI